MANRNEWFGEWFNSPYYHILYKHRDLDEARRFIDNISEHLHLEQGAKAMDVGRVVTPSTSTKKGLMSRVLT